MQLFLDALINVTLLAVLLTSDTARWLLRKINTINRPPPPVQGIHLVEAPDPISNH